MEIICPSLYKFLNFALNNNVEKSILDCGAGGPLPPITIFKRYGFSCFGIEISDKKLTESQRYSKDNNIELGIIKGDMRNIPFKENAFGFVYSYNSIMHLSKLDAKRAILEFKRVLKPGGYVFVNFLSMEDCSYGKGDKVGDDEFKQIEHGDEVIHTFYKDDEPDKYFENMDVFFKEKRKIFLKNNGNLHIQSYLEYIAKKLE